MAVIAPVASIFFFVVVVVVVVVVAGGYLQQTYKTESLQVMLSDKMMGAF